MDTNDTHKIRSSYDATWRAANKEKISADNKRRARILRLAAIAAYGGKCACCGLDNEWFLSIDHINNDGAEHRRTMGNKGSGDHLYRWLAKHNYPEGFQALCYNCNLGKARNGGVCPHKSLPAAGMEQRPLATPMMSNPDLVRIEAPLPPLVN